MRSSSDHDTSQEDKYRQMESELRRENDKAVRREARRAVIIHGVLFTMLLGYLYFGVPFSHRLLEGGLPMRTGYADQAFCVAEFVRQQVLVIIVAMPILLWLDSKQYVWLHRHYGNRATQWWFWTGIVAVVLVVLVCEWAWWASCPDVTADI